MSNIEMGGYTAPTEQIYGNLSYEQLIARSVDRCLHNRVVAKESLYLNSVQALHLSLVDIGGKMLRTRADESWMEINRSTDSLIEKYDKLFSAITKILADHKMLFRSILVETGREQVYR